MIGKILDFCHILVIFYQGATLSARGSRSDLPERLATRMPDVAGGAWQRLPVLLVVCTATALAGCSPVIQPVSPATVMITADEASEIHITEAGDGIVLDVLSKHGFGQASVVLPAAHDFEQLEIRLHLSGLEQFILAYGNEQIVLSMSAEQGRMRQAHTLTTGQGQRYTELDEDHPNWLAVEYRESGQIGEGDVNARNGIFVVKLPITGELDRTFTLQWVDFLR